MQAVCDRFADDISFVLVRDVIAHEAGALSGKEQLEALYVQRMQQLIAPAKDHDLPVAISTPGAVAPLLPMLHEIGFDIIHPASLDHNAIRAAKEPWQEKLVFAGGVTSDILRYGDQQVIQQHVREVTQYFAEHSGHIFGVSGTITDDIPPENFVAMTQTLNQHGRHTQWGASFTSDLL